jgi:hypothetical protein
VRLKDTQGVVLEQLDDESRKLSAKAAEVDGMSGTINHVKGAQSLFSDCLSAIEQALSVFLPVICTDSPNSNECKELYILYKCDLYPTVFHKHAGGND